MLHGVDFKIKETTSTHAPPGELPSPSALTEAPAAILPLPGQSVDRLCVDIEHSQGPMNLLSDPDQGERYTSSQFTQRDPGTIHLQLTTLETTVGHLPREAHEQPCPVFGRGIVTPLSINTCTHTSTPQAFHWAHICRSPWSGTPG